MLHGSIVLRRRSLFRMFKRRDDVSTVSLVNLNDVVFDTDSRSRIVGQRDNRLVGGIPTSRRRGLFCSVIRFRVLRLAASLSAFSIEKVVGELRSTARTRNQENTVERPCFTTQAERCGALDVSRRSI